MNLGIAVENHKDCLILVVWYSWSDYWTKSIVQDFSEFNEMEPICIPFRDFTSYHER